MAASASSSSMSVSSIERCAARRHEGIAVDLGSEHQRDGDTTAMAQGCDGRLDGKYARDTMKYWLRTYLRSVCNPMQWSQA